MGHMYVMDKLWTINRSRLRAVENVKNCVFTFLEKIEMVDYDINMN